MAFNSINFLVFMPIVALIYFLLPLKIRYIWLLLASYFFYMCWNPKYVVLLLFATIISYLCGGLLECVQSKGLSVKTELKLKKGIVAVGICGNIGMLAFFKYYDFAFQTIERLLLPFGIQIHVSPLKYLLPVGISFYTFQVVGYMIDVYRQEVKAEKNFLRYALFVAFFPQIGSGPIARAKNLLKQLQLPTRFDMQNVRYGLLTMAYGLFLKLVIADRIATVITPVHLEYEQYHGMQLILCIILFGIQIYCDFHGYTQIAIGSARVFGYALQENFNAPYLSPNIKMFWRNWHISLTSWFTDYLYIPLGGNRKGNVRKYINMMIVFLSSGLWHGASWSFVVWGGLNGVYLVLYEVIHPWWECIRKKIQINQETKWWKGLSCVITFVLVDYAWLYFWAGDFSIALGMQRKIASDFFLPYLLSDNIWVIFQNYTTIVVLLVSMLILWITDYLHYKGVDWKNTILKQQFVFRWMLYLVLFFTLIIYGVYGTGYETKAAQFIYFRF